MKSCLLNIFWYAYAYDLQIVQKYDFLERRRLNIEENEWMKEQLGLKKV